MYLAKDFHSFSDPSCRMVGVWPGSLLDIYQPIPNKNLKCYNFRSDKNTLFKYIVRSSIRNYTMATKNRNVH